MLKSNHLSSVLIHLQICTPLANVNLSSKIDNQNIKENNQLSHPNASRSKQLGLNPNLNIED